MLLTTLTTSDITVKVKANMRFAKIFEAAEVCHKTASLRVANQTVTQKKFGKEAGESYSSLGGMLSERTLLLQARLDLHTKVPGSMLKTLLHL
jgi:hypothetical protein